MIRSDLLGIPALLQPEQKFHANWLKPTLAITPAKAQTSASCQNHQCQPAVDLQLGPENSR